MQRKHITPELSQKIKERFTELFNYGDSKNKTDTTCTSITFQQRCDQLKFTMEHDEVCECEDCLLGLKPTPPKPKLTKEAVKWIKHLHGDKDKGGMDFSIMPVNMDADRKPRWKWIELEHQKASPQKIKEGFEKLDANIAILTGGYSGIVVIDADDNEAVEMVEKLCPPTAIKTQTYKGRHYYFLHPNHSDIKNSSSKGLLINGKKYKIEIKSTGCAVTAPMSVHKTGFIYKAIGDWTAETLKKLPVFDPMWLREDIEPVATHKPQPDINGEIELCNAAKWYLKNGHETPIGERNHALFTTACSFQAAKISLDDAIAALSPIAFGSGLDVNEVQITIESAFNKERTAPIDENNKHDYSSIGTRKLGWDKKNNDDWIPFPEAALTPVEIEIANAVADSMLIDPVGFILPALSTLDTAIGSSRMVVVKDGWKAIPMVWGVVIKASGGLKSPPFLVATKILKVLDDEVVKQFEIDMSKYEHDMLEYKSTMNKTGSGQKPTKPVCLRCHTQVATLQAVHKILSDNPRGIIVANDELSAWVKSMDQFQSGEKGGDLACWLMLRNGSGGVIDRMSYSLRFPETSTNISGTITSETWSEVMGGINAKNGLTARFLPVMPPHKVAPYTEKGISNAVIENYHNLVMKLFTLQPDDNGKPIEVRWNDKAKKLFIEYFNESAELTNNEKSQFLGSVYSKLNGQCATFALSRHLIRWTQDESIDPTVIDETSMQMAVTMARWFRNESKRIHHLLIKGMLTDEDKVVDFLKNQKDGASYRNIKRKLFNHKSAQDVQKFLNELVSCDTIREKKVTVNNREYLKYAF